MIDKGGIPIDKLDEKLKALHERAHLAILRNLLNSVKQHDTAVKEPSEQEQSDRLYELLGKHIDAVYEQHMEIERLQTHVHVVFSLSDAGSLKVALSKVGKRQQSRVLAFNSWFSVGPIADLDTPEGQQRRQSWLLEHVQDDYFFDTINRDHQIAQLMKELKAIPEHKTVVIWCADNGHDQTGLRFALYLLKDRKQPIHIVNVTKVSQALGFRQNGGETPYAQALIDRENYVEIVRDYAEGFPLDSDTRKRYETDWIELAGQNHWLRLWEDGKLIGCDEDKLDPVIIQSVIDLQGIHEAGDYVHAGEVMGRVLEASRQRISISFLTYRILRLTSDGVLNFKGIPGLSLQYSIRLSSARGTTKLGNSEEAANE
ncbi:hypothetical protein BBD40_04795 [Paenibacillus ihbetae]|uniref:DUF1835 domain-containing protein n=1 Tax=Paenibacillus ihbetae TaxID=1870820 RepID=A0ABX3JUB8_9BACL|nr:hypothetical protein BBD40_04795 [Paenibacillus ihbetae]